MFAGTYHTKFVPDLTLTIDRVVDLDCAPGYRCRGDISVNLPNWLGLEFGNVHGSEIGFSRLDKVVDPDAPDTLVDPPADLGAWLSALPGLTVEESAKSVTVGDITATQLDVMTGEDPVSFGPTGLTSSDAPQSFGLPPNRKARLIVMSVGGQTVLITEQIGAENTVGDFQAAVESLQPLLDSITWR